MHKLPPAAAVAVAAAAALSGSALAAKAPAAKMAAGGTKLHVTAVANGLAFSTKSLKAKAGSITISLTNASALKHDLVIEQGEKVLARTPMLAKGKTGSLKVSLKKGTYDFVCDVPGHEGAGMKGTLTVS